MKDTTETPEKTLSYVASELNRVETMAGTLATIETEHYKALTNMGDDELNQMAVEEQSAARQLGEMKQICLSLAQQINQLQDEIKNPQNHSGDE